MEAWFSGLHHPLEPAMRRVRDIILGADPRMTELVQYGTVQFTSKSGLCSFVQVKDKKRVSLMFNAAGRIPGEYPHQEVRPTSRSFGTRRSRPNFCDRLP